MRRENRDDLELNDMPLAIRLVVRHVVMVFIAVVVAVMITAVGIVVLRGRLPVLLPGFLLSKWLGVNVGPPEARLFNGSVCNILVWSAITYIVMIVTSGLISRRRLSVTK